MSKDNIQNSIVDQPNKMFSENSQSAFYPTGSIIAYFRTTVDPSGWIVCDGITRTDNSDGKYNELYNLGIGTGGNGTTSYTPPNLKGAFLRGAGQSGINSIYVGPTVKTFQDMGIVDHSHNVVHYHNTLDPKSTKYSAVYRSDYQNMDNGGLDYDNSKTEPNIKDSAPNPFNSSATDVNNGNNQLNSVTYVNNSTTESRPFNYGVNWILKL